MKSKPQFTIRTILIIVAVFAVIAAGATTLLHWNLAATDLDRLLSGDETILIDRMQIEFHQRSVDCSDQSVNKYLSKIMRSATLSANGGGQSYYFRFHFSTGRTYQLYGQITASEFSLSVPNSRPHDPGYPTHLIKFSSPVPDRVQEVFNFVVAPHSEVAGLALRIRDGRLFEYEYVPTLHEGNRIGTRVYELIDANKL